MCDACWVGSHLCSWCWRERHGADEQPMTTVLACSKHQANYHAEFGLTMDRLSGRCCAAKDAEIAALHKHARQQLNDLKLLLTEALEFIMADQGLTSPAELRRWRDHFHTRARRALGRDDDAR